MDNDETGTEGTGPLAPAAPNPEPETQEGEAFETQGRTLVRTKPRYDFAPSDKSLPVITPEGVYMNAEQAKAVIDEADEAEEGLVYIDKEGD